MIKSQRHTRSGAGRGVSQANKAAIYPKLTGLIQHEIVSGMLNKYKQFGTVQASYGCLVGHVCMGVRNSVFPPYLCNASILGLDEYANGCLFEKEQIDTLFVLVGAPEGGFKGGGVHPKNRAWRPDFCRPLQFAAPRNSVLILPL